MTLSSRFSMAEINLLSSSISFDAILCSRDFKALLNSVISCCLYLTIFSLNASNSCFRPVSILSKLSEILAVRSPRSSSYLSTFFTDSLMLHDEIGTLNMKSESCWFDALLCVAPHTFGRQAAGSHSICRIYWWTHCDGKRSKSLSA